MEDDYNMFSRLYHKTDNIEYFIYGQEFKSESGFLGDYDCFENWEEKGSNQLRHFFIR